MIIAIKIDIKIDTKPIGFNKYKHNDIKTDEKILLEINFKSILIFIYRLVK